MKMSSKTRQHPFGNRLSIKDVDKNICENAHYDVGIGADNDGVIYGTDYYP